MASDPLDPVRQDLAALRSRFARGEIDRAEYQAQRELILADLTPEERAALGTASPAPGSVTPPASTPPPSTPRPSTPAALGPSGARGAGLRTSIPTLADLGLSAGTVLLGQWRLARELGRGGFGAVFEAEELHLHEKQAVKVLDPAMVAKEELLARFRREVSLMRKLVHPRIVRVYDYREDPEQLVALISMELVTGGSVKQLVTLAREKREPIPIALALEILHQTLEALAEAHSQGVIHRDVTPGNVLLAGGTPEQLLADPKRDPRVKLVDFGIAGLVERSELSQKSRVLGTAAYVAPEVLDPAAEVTPAADVYGAGAMAYELLTGRLPLGRFAEPGQVRADLPAAISGLVLELLDSDPARRPKAAQGARDVPRILEEHARLETERRLAEERARREAEEARRRQEAELERRRSEEAQREAERNREAEVARFRAEQERLRRAAEEEREREAARQREVAAREQERAEAERWRLEERARQQEAARLEDERLRMATEHRRLEEWARQQEAARQAKESARLEAERERHRNATVRRVEAEASVQARSGTAKKKKLSPVALGALAAALLAAVVALGWGISAQRAMRERARAKAAQLEEEKLATVEPEKRRAAEAAEAAVAGTPRAIGFDPPLEARSVDPRRKTISVTFDRPMDTGGWAWVKEDEATSPIDRKGGSSWDSAGRTNTVAVALSPGKDYVVWVNSKEFAHFKDTKGTPAAPVRWVFSTGDDGAFKRRESAEAAAGEAERRQKREAEAAAERQREAVVAAQRQQELEAAAQEQKEADAAAQRQREAELESERRVAEEKKRQLESEAAWRAQQAEQARLKGPPTTAWHDVSTGLLWAGKDNGANIGWNGAMAFCEALTLDGYSDWRLPTLEELRGLYHRSPWKRSNTRGEVELTACCAWSGDKKKQKRGLYSAGLFYFSIGTSNWSPLDIDASNRALCVRP